MRRSEGVGVGGEVVVVMVMVKMGMEGGWMGWWEVLRMVLGASVKRGGGIRSWGRLFRLLGA